MEYSFKDIELKWQTYWKTHQTYKTLEDYNKPKYYVLDMFPYPSGSGLHVGHPLGYIASDIVARYKCLKGYNVLHPMGYDSFGLPAEQYAIQTGKHPAETTENNIIRYREQLDRMGFSFDWSREVRTSDPSYYRWTQWIFLKLFNSWFNCKSQQAEPIETLEALFATHGYAGCSDYLTKDSDEPSHTIFSAEDWNQFNESERKHILMQYRLAYLGEAYVNWCPALGTVLANDEVKEGYSERGGYPVERKQMKQWSLRITAYAQRLLNGLETLDWSDAIKESQRNWIGKSEGCTLSFKLKNSEQSIRVFTTRPDTIFGVSFLTLAPEHEDLIELSLPEFKEAVKNYCKLTQIKSERERQADIKAVSGQFTGNYAIHPFTNQPIPVYTSDYVLSGYGTGAVMGVPAHDARDHRFAKHFQLPIIQVIDGPEVKDTANESKAGLLINSDFLNGQTVQEAIQKVISKIEMLGIGKRKLSFRLRDAAFGRQRYWGEPIPIYYKNDLPEPVSETELPLLLPEIDQFLPTESGAPPLARALNWKYKNAYLYETTTMPGWAGSSWYYLRYMDPHNTHQIARKEAMKYWQSIDLYIGGSEHATGHLLYVRFWSMVLFDLGIIPHAEPIQKLVNQGMIQGTSCMIHRDVQSQHILSAGLAKNRKTSKIHIDVSLVENQLVDIDALKQWRPEFKDLEYELENGCLIAEQAVEKMSKRWHNVVNPDAICERYGADTLRLYEMFLGPLEQSKPWNTTGISGITGFLKKLWRLFYQDNQFMVTQEPATDSELKILHKCIKKITEDYERLSFNTSVSQFMITVNELHEIKCYKRPVLEPLLILLSPMAPHVCEELWFQLGHQSSIRFSTFPEFQAGYIKEDRFKYPVSINGKVKLQLELPYDWAVEHIENHIKKEESVQQLLQNKIPKRIIIVPRKIINIVI